MKHALFTFVLLAACALMPAPRGFAADAKPGAGKKIVFLVAESEYHAATTIPEFAKQIQEKYGFQCEVLLGSQDDKDPNRHYLPHMEKLKDADLIVIQVRRRALPKEQMAALRAYVDSGKPVIGIRTASHAFSMQAPKPLKPGAKASPAPKIPEGLEQWPGFDKEIMGCFYQNHYGKAAGNTIVTVNPEKKNHPILAGVPEKFESPSWLYKIEPVEPTAEILMRGKIEGKDAEAVVMTNTPAKGNRVVYTTLGHEDDYKIPAFQRILINSVFWTLKMDPPKE